MPRPTWRLNKSRNQAVFEVSSAQTDGGEEHRGDGNAKEESNRDHGVKCIRAGQ
jgi:hypothetical protein